MVGDGCEICNPEYAKQLESELDDECDTCESCTHNNDCSMQHAARLSGNAEGFGCTVHKTEKELMMERRNELNKVAIDWNVKNGVFEEPKKKHNAKDQ